MAISLGCIHTCPHCCCRAACGIRFGALFSRQRSFCFLYCDMYLRFRGCPVVLDIELCVSAWYHKTRCALLRSRCLLLAAASCGSQQRAAVCGVRQNFQNYMQYGAETKEPFCANENTKTSRSIQSTPSTSRRIFSFVETPCMDLRAGPTRKVIRRRWRLFNPQSTHAPPRRDRGLQNTCLYIPLAYVYQSGLSREQWRLALSKREKLCWKGRGGSDRLGP